MRQDAAALPGLRRSPGLRDQGRIVGQGEPRQLVDSRADRLRVARSPGVDRVALLRRIHGDECRMGLAFHVCQEGDRPIVRATGDRPDRSSERPVDRPNVQSSVPCCAKATGAGPVSTVARTREILAFRRMSEPPMLSCSLDDLILVGAPRLVAEFFTHPLRAIRRLPLGQPFPFGANCGTVRSLHDRMDHVARFRPAIVSLPDRDRMGAKASPRLASPRKLPDDS